MYARVANCVVVIDNMTAELSTQPIEFDDENIIDDDDINDDKDGEEDGMALHTESADDALAQLIELKQMQRRSNIVISKKTKFLLQTRCIDMFEILFNKLEIDKLCRDGNIDVYSYRFYL